MKTIIVAIVVAVALAACGQVDRGVAAFTGYSKMCVDGLSVVQMTSGAFYERNADNTLVRCK